MLLSKGKAVFAYNQEWLLSNKQGCDSLWLEFIKLNSELHFDDFGKLASVSPYELDQANEAIQRRVKTANLDDGLGADFVRWIREDPIRRTLAPHSKVPTWEYVGNILTQPSKAIPSTINDCAARAPWHPLEPLSLARLEPKPDDQTDAATRETLLIRPRFLARLTLKRLRNANEQIYGRDTLAEYAAWSAKIMHDELHLVAEARETLAFALDRTPLVKQKKLLELKVEIDSK